MNHTEDLYSDYIKNIYTRYQWLTPVILATQEAEIGRIVVWKPDK
jgi:hypothetical protein